MAIKALVSDLEAVAHDRQAGRIHFQLMCVGNVIDRVTSLFPSFLKQRASLKNSKPDVRQFFVGFGGSEGGNEVMC